MLYVGWMHFDLVDGVLELTESGVVTLKNVSAAEEYLQDHFPTFPVLPGVLMIESLVQAARRWIEHTGRGNGQRWVLSGVRALKYGTFVRPGQTMRISVTFHAEGSDSAIEFKGSAEVLTPGQPQPEGPPTSVSGRFTMRPLRIGRDVR